MNENLEDITEKEIKKPGFIKKNIKKIALGAGALFLSATLSIGYLGLKKEGKSLSSAPDGKIDTEYYHELFKNKTKIKDISQIEDLVVEVFNLDKEKDIKDFRFNMFDEENMPLRFQLARYFIKDDLNGLEWGNGDIYIQDLSISKVLYLLFHETGHKSEKDNIDFISSKIRHFRQSSEPLAEKNVIESMISLMYIDPELGYSVFTEIFDSIYRFYAFKNKNPNKWFSAYELNLLRLSNDDIQIKDWYDSNQEVISEVNKLRSDRSAEEIVIEGYKGLLSRFRQRFKDKKDFKEKYEKLRDYFEFGTTSQIYNDLQMAKDNSYIKKIKSKNFFDQIKEKYAPTDNNYNFKDNIVQYHINRKVSFLEKDIPEIIRSNVTRSLIQDYFFIEDYDKAYDLFINKFKDKNKVDDPLLLLWSIDYSIKNEKKESKELFDILKKRSKDDERLKPFIDKYEPNF